MKLIQIQTAIWGKRNTNKNVTRLTFVHALTSYLPASALQNVQVETSNYVSCCLQNSIVSISIYDRDLD